MASHEVMPEERRLLEDVLDAEGRFDAARVAALLDWKVEEIAQYLDRDPSTVSKYPTSVRHQDRLAALVGVFQALVTSFGNRRLVRGWFRLPLGALDGASPKAVILRGELPRVSDLIAEWDAGFAA